MKVNRKALDRLSAASASRAELVREGFMDLLAYADLHGHGYTIRVWFRCRDGAVAYEYLPRKTGKEYRHLVRHHGLPRVLVRTHAEQVRLHKALGLSIARAGEVWADNPLFAGLEV